MMTKKDFQFIAETIATDLSKSGYLVNDPETAQTVQVWCDALITQNDRFDSEKFTQAVRKAMES